MTTDPRIEPIAAYLHKTRWMISEKEATGVATRIIENADAVDPLRNPTDADIERAAKALHEDAGGTNWDDKRSWTREHYLEYVRVVVAALRGGAE